MPFAVCRPHAQIDSQLVAIEHQNVAPGTAATATALCGKSRHASGGGGRFTGRIGQAWLAASRPVDTASDADSVPDDGWRVAGYNATGAVKSLWSVAVCVSDG